MSRDGSKKLASNPLRPLWKMSSPWIAELDQFSFPKLRKALITDVIIVGGGISGILTAYFLLKLTQVRVAVLDSGEIGGGATGRNAGLLVNGFEMGLPEMVQTFGTTQTKSAILAGEMGIRLLRTISQSLPVPTIGGPLSYYLYYTNVKLALRHRALVRDAGEMVEKLFHFVDPRASGEERIDKRKMDSIGFPRPELIQYVARFGRCYLINARQFTRQLARKIMHEYGSRVQVFESSSVSCLSPEQLGFLGRCRGWRVRASNVVLCTNGYHLDQAVSRMAKTIMPTEEYLKAVLQPHLSPDSAWVWYTGETDDEIAYRSSRTWRGESLQITGGKGGTRGRLPTKGKSVTGAYAWSGLQGYTSTGVRLITEDADTPRCYLNMGCNGIGMALAAYGAQRIAQMVRGDALPINLFGGPASVSS